MRRYFLLVAGAILTMSPSGAVVAADPTVHVVIKFVKSKDGSGPVAALDRDSCPACVDENDPAFARDNPRETLLDLRIPAGRQLELAFVSPAKSVRRVIVESDDLPFRREGGRLLVSVPPLREDVVETGEFATHLVEPGMILRLEHADPARLAGAYAGKPLPAIQRQAANALEFAQREAIRALGLGDYVARQGLGVIEVMGFDTNNPHGHRDAPPHIHMHLRWPFNTGTQIGHFYIGADGLLDRNTAGITRFNLPERVFARGETFTTIGNTGKPVYTQTITAEGWLKLATAWSDRPATCLIRPVTGGFQSGAVVACDGRPAVQVTVSDDIVAGITRVRAGQVIETIRYDPDTGRLLSPTKPPARPEDTVEPISTTVFPLADARPVAPPREGPD